MQAQQTQRQNNVTWKSVPQFGAWDQKNPVDTDYSMIFNQARDTRKQHKSDVRRSVGNDPDDITTPFLPKYKQHKHYKHKHKKQQQQQQPPVSKKKKILTYINCCIKP